MQSLRISVILGVSAVNASAHLLTAETPRITEIRRVETGATAHSFCL